MLVNSSRIECGRRASLPAFSLVEIMITIVLISFLAAMAIGTIGNTKTAVSNTKLVSDVKKLNEIIAVYLSEGGSLSSAANAQAVINQLKTVRPQAEVVRNVGVMTGRGVDMRLTARTQTTAEAASKNLRAVWNSTTLQFDLATTGTGVAEFNLDDSLASPYSNTDVRAQSNELYNNVNGWVWAAGTNTAAAFLTPIDVAITDTTTLFDPTVTPPATSTTSTTSTSSTSTSTSSSSTGGTTGSTATSTSTSSTSSSSSSTSSSSSSSTTGVVATKLPTPSNSPAGGTYSTAAFPSTISINANGAPGGSSSTLKYKINSGSWIVYTGPFAINSGDKVTSENFSNDTVHYTDSATDADTYYKLTPSFTGTVTPTWTNVAGGPTLVDTTTNTNPDSVTLSHGDTRQDLGNGEYLDAGTPNTMTFARAGIAGVAPNTAFSLGTLNVLNGTTFNNSEATSATLNLAIALTLPTVTNTTVPINFTMTSTNNTSDRTASADYVTVQNPTTSFTVTSGGVTYTLKVWLATSDSDNGWVSGNTFYIYEGASATASIMAQFVSNH